MWEAACRSIDGAAVCTGEQLSMCTCGSVHTSLCPRTYMSSERPSQGANSNVLGSGQLWSRPLSHVGLLAGPSIFLTTEASACSGTQSSSPHCFNVASKADSKARGHKVPGPHPKWKASKEGRLPGVQEACSPQVIQPTSRQRSVSVRPAGSIDSLFERFRKTTTKLNRLQAMGLLLPQLL